MGIILTSMYVAITLLSPSVLPEEIWSLHVSVILGILTILSLLPSLGEAKLGKLPDSYFVLGLLVAVALSTVRLGLSTVPTTIADTIPSFIVFYFVAVSCRKLSHLSVLTYVMVAVALFIFWQGWSADQAGNLASPYIGMEGYGPDAIRRYRGLGVVNDPNDLGQLFVTLIPLLFLRWKKGAFLSNVILTLVPAAFLVAGTYHTHSRGDAIALLAVALFAFKDKLGLILSSILVAGLFAGMMALNISGGRGMSDDDGGRVAAWATGLEIFRAHPLLGVGIGQFSDYNDTGHTAHNSYILSLSETGLVGYFCWMGTIVAGITGLSQVVRSKSGTGGSPQAAGPGLQSRRFGYPQPAAARPVAGAVPFQSLALATPNLAAVAYQPPALANPWAPASVQFGETKPLDDDSDVIAAAKVLRVAFVGLLTSAFFLSRSFSMIFYIMLGMAAFVRTLYLSRHPERVMDRKVMMKRICMVLVGSVIFLYLFVRIRGIH